MTELSRNLFTDFHIRKSKKQKEAFRSWLCDMLTAQGYAPATEKTISAANVVVGDPEKAKVIYTAHYDTCAVLPFPNFITPRNLLWYLCYQILLVIPMFVPAIAAEVGTILLWERITGAECPMWAAMAALYIVLAFSLWWLMDGPANKHTANDNTSGVLTLLEIALTLPSDLRGEVCFVFFDNEEKGLLGSSAFAKKHPAVKKGTLLVNFDCVSDGDSIQFFPTKTVKADNRILSALSAAFPAAREKTTEIVTGFGFYPSDQAQFKRGVGVCALKKKPVIGYYMDRIHTKKDTVLMEENIELLRGGAIRLAEILAAAEQSV